MISIVIMFRYIMVIPECIMALTDVLRQIVIGDGGSPGRARTHGVTNTSLQGEGHGAVLLVHRVIRGG